MRILIFSLIICSTSFASAKFLETKCNNNNCFKYGWTTTEPGTNYILQCQCRDNDCINVGWKSTDSQNSSYKVTCKSGGCFEDGWTSIQKDNGNIFIDIVSCKESDCLKEGWDITSAYNEGGEVVCKNKNCGKFGGISYWRNQISETKCIKDDCYKYGWTAIIQE